MQKIKAKESKRYDLQYTDYQLFAYRFESRFLMIHQVADNQLIKMLENSRARKNLSSHQSDNGLETDQTAVEFRQFFLGGRLIRNILQMIPVPTCLDDRAVGSH